MDDFERTLSETAAVAPEFIGLTEVAARERARDLGVRFRSWTDADPDLTADYDARRVTVKLDGGDVVEADAG